MCLIICVAVVGAVSNSTYADMNPLTKTPTGHKSSTSEYETSGATTSRSFTTRTRTTVTTATTVYTGYSGYSGYTGYNGGGYYGGGYYNGGYYNGGYYNGGYYPYQNYCNPYYYPSYNCNAYYPSYPSYQVPTATTTFTQENYVTEMVVSTASVMIPTTLTSTVMVTTTDTSSVTFYGISVAVLLVLLGASVFLLLLSRSKTNRPPQTYTVPGHYCRNCGNHLNQPDRFCVKCGTQQTP